ncbi:MAG: peptidase M24 [Deltaproteobacteria bacterium HGW-Deltaproteobacteria-21]|nr:MAG: peptidase M24 [Deltaproteobacteria bacterium HGW-Deltaproteobacteria-21]
MEDPKQRLTTSISDGELERRWNAVREIMRERKIDYLIARNDEEFLGGYVKWFTDIPARHSYPYTVIFPVDEEMTLVSPGANPPADPGPPPWAVRGVKQRLGAPYFPSAHYTSTYDAELVTGVLKGKKSPAIGLVGKSYIPMNFFEYVSKSLPAARFVDVTEEVDRLKAVKSPEEQELIRRTAALQDKAVEHLRKTIRPGMRDFEIYAEVLYNTTLNGSERQLILVSSGPQGTPVPFAPRRFQNRVVKEGDQISVLVEVNGPGGLYTEVGRIFSVGKPSQELQDAFGTALEAQQVSLRMIKPGASCKEIWDANSAFLEKKGYLPERRLYAHGQGYDLVERPLIRYDEPMKIMEGMNLTVHPNAISKTVWAGVTDNYIVTKDGVGECIHKTPKEIIVI